MSRRRHVWYEGRVIHTDARLTLAVVLGAGVLGGVLGTIGLKMRPPGGREVIPDPVHVSRVEDARMDRADLRATVTATAAERGDELMSGPYSHPELDMTAGREEAGAVTDERVPVGVLTYSRAFLELLSLRPNTDPLLYAPDLAGFQHAVYQVEDENGVPVYQDVGLHELEALWPSVAVDWAKRQELFAELSLCIARDLPAGVTDALKARHGDATRRVFDALDAAVGREQ